MADDPVLQDSLPSREEGETANTTVNTDTTTIPEDVATEMDLSGLINSQIKQLDNLKEQIGKFKEMLDGVFANDETYQAHDTALKEAQKIKNNTKKQIQKLAPVQDSLSRIQDLKNTLKDVTKSLSENLQMYATSTGSTTFETDDGQVREIVYTARLVKKNDFRP